jgi:acetyltransferase
MALYLHAVFYPRAVAVVGVTDTPDRVGYNLLESVLSGGYRGLVYPVHPRLKEVQGLKVYNRLEDVPGPVDLAVIGLNQHATVEAVETCGRLGVKGVVCVAGGYREMGDEGKELEERLVAAARKHDMALIGPNTLGLINTEAGLNATFYPMPLRPGRVSFLSQSGGIGLVVLRKAEDEGLGINKWVGVGNRSVLEFADYLEYLAGDPGTSVIGVFMEGIDDARRFVQTAARVAETKPVVIYKAGRAEGVSYAALTHTGSMAGSFAVFRDVCRQFDLFLVSSAAELVAACKALAYAPLPRGNGVGVLTHTAGPSIALLDRLLQHGCLVPELRSETLDKIKEVLGPNPPVVLKNPLDGAGQAFLPEPYGRLAAALLEDPQIHLLVGIHCLHRHWRFPSRELADLAARYGKPVLACYVSTWEGAREDREWLQEAGVPVYTSPEEAAVGAAALIHYSRRRGVSTCGP